MRRIHSLSLAGLALAVAASFGMGPQPGGLDDAINKDCPIGKEAIDGKTFVTYKDHTIGLCCGGCDAKFLAWDEAKKDAFVAAAIGAVADDQDSAPKDEESKSDLYTLDTCPISGGKLGSMGDPIVKEYDGREVRFCCGGCIAKFEADTEAAFKKIDEKLIKQQLAYYPMDNCVVGGDALTEDGEDIAINFVYRNRLVRFCCNGCVKGFKKDPEKYLAKLDKAVVEQQRKNYPLDTCIVAGGELGGMGEPTEMIVGNRLFRFCCAGCEKKLVADPAKYVALLDKAWKEKKADAGERD